MIWITWLKQQVKVLGVYFCFNLLDEKYVQMKNFCHDLNKKLQKSVRLFENFQSTKSKIK